MGAAQAVHEWEPMRKLRLATSEGGSAEGLRGIWGWVGDGGVGTGLGRDEMEMSKVRLAPRLVLVEGGLGLPSEVELLKSAISVLVLEVVGLRRELARMKRNEERVWGAGPHA